MTQRIIKLKPQRIAKGCSIRAWVHARDRGFDRSWRVAIDKDLRRRAISNEQNVHWLDNKASD